MTAMAERRKYLIIELYHVCGLNICRFDPREFGVAIRSRENGKLGSKQVKTQAKTGRKQARIGKKKPPKTAKNW